MCPSQKILNQTKNGLFTFCEHSKLFQFVFNNLCFELYEWELEKFLSYLNDIDYVYWEQQLKNSLHSRKIPITVGNQHFMILVSRQELLELKELLQNEGRVQSLRYQEIDYNFIAN